jgi:DNA-binding response OmpR family regulator
MSVLILIILEKFYRPQEESYKSPRRLISGLFGIAMGALALLTLNLYRWSTLTNPVYANDNYYITKPIKPRALMSRIAALFRRDSKKEKEKGQIKIRDLKIDRSSYTIDKAGKTITLPKKEFELLYFLANNPNVVFSRDELLHNIWGSDVFVLARTVDVHIRKVREKIGEEYISTVKGVGYKFELG